jgi:hypothetical protein
MTEPRITPSKKMLRIAMGGFIPADTAILRI